MSEAARVADRAAENAYFRLLSRVMMMLTPPVFGFLAWQVLGDMREMKGEVGELGIDVARIEGRLGSAESRVAEHTASIDGIGDRGQRHQQDVIGRLAGVEAEVRGLRLDINRLFDAGQQRSGVRGQDARGSNSAARLE